MQVISEKFHNSRNMVLLWDNHYMDYKTNYLIIFSYNLNKISNVRIST
jgi:hypothetical protein